MADRVLTTPPQTVTRRLLAAGGAAFLGLAATPAAATAAPHLDAELICTCRSFAEAHLESWYRYVVAPDELADELPWATDWQTLDWITRTPAHTTAGWQAKALAYSAWDRDHYDAPPGECGSGDPLLAALLRDMVGAARAAIVAKLAAQYGPLPAGYTPDGRWLGSTTVAEAEPAPHRDAELLALCRRFDELERKFVGLFHGATCIEDENERDEQIALIRAVQEPLLPRILALQATTFDGLMARVRTAFLEDPDAARDAMKTLAQSAYVNERLQAVLHRDLIIFAGVETCFHGSAGA